MTRFPLETLQGKVIAVVEVQWRLPDGAAQIMDVGESIDGTSFFGIEEFVVEATDGTRLVVEAGKPMTLRIRDGVLVKP